MNVPVHPLRSRLVFLVCMICTTASDCAVWYDRALKREKEQAVELTPPTECHVGKGLVSVVVPAYNEGDGIKLTLTTIDELAQVQQYTAQQ